MLRGVATVRDATKNREKVNTILMSIEKFAFINETDHNSTYESVSILGWFKQKYPEIEVHGVEFLETAGASATQRMIFYRRDPLYVKMPIVEEFKELPAQKLGTVSTIHCRSKFGGVDLLYPLSMCYIDGI